MSVTLFTPIESGYASVSEFWCVARDRDPHVLDLFSRHYSCGKNATSRANHARCGIVGPGESLVLISPLADALFVWRLERFRFDGREGVNCSVFRNESPVLSSVLIRDAARLAWEQWPGMTLFTFVAPTKVRSSNPGCCYKKAGWRHCGQTEKGLLTFEILPEGNTQ